MKRNIIGLLFLCLCIGACDREFTHEKQQGAQDSYSTGNVMVIKFTQPEYREHILVAFPEQEEECLSVSPTTRWLECYTLPRVIQDLYRQAPYTELLDNYLLIDWKYYRAITRILVEQATIITNKWDEMDDLYKCWPPENLYIKYPFEEIIKIPLDSLNVYNGGLKYPTTNMFPIIYQDNYDFYDYNGSYQNRINEIQQYIPIADSAYIEYETVLNKMIQEGVLGDYGKYIYKK